MSRSVKLQSSTSLIKYAHFKNGNYNVSKLFMNYLVAIGLFAISAVGFTTASIVSPVATPPAQAASLLEWLQWASPTGAYANFNGHKLYFGSLNDESLLFSRDVTWQIQGQSGPIAKGYGRVSSAFIRGLYQFFLQPVRVE
jgi:hypothetical protein